MPAIIIMLLIMAIMWFYQQDNGETLGREKISRQKDPKYFKFVMNLQAIGLIFVGLMIIMFIIMNWH